MTLPVVIPPKHLEQPEHDPQKAYLLTIAEISIVFQMFHLFQLWGV
jgi:hypothetical protein